MTNTTIKEKTSHGDGVAKHLGNALRLFGALYATGIGSHFIQKSITTLKSPQFNCCNDAAHAILDLIAGTAVGLVGLYGIYLYPPMRYHPHSGSYSSKNKFENNSEQDFSDMDGICYANSTLIEEICPATYGEL